MQEGWIGMSVRVEHGDMLQVLGRMVANGESVQAIITDPPYHLTSIVKRFGAENAAPAKIGETGAYARASRGFMGKQWDGGDIAFRSGTWRLCWELLPPGGHLLAFSGTRTYHRMATAIEEAGFEIRDMVAWLYGAGFPKSLNVSKALDKMAGAEREVIGTEKVRDIRNGHGRGIGDGINATERDGPVYMQRELTAPATDAAREWEGWGTALKPALEPICLARKPLIGTVAGNVLAHGTGALNIDGCRVAAPEGAVVKMAHRDTGAARGYDGGLKGGSRTEPQTSGRWPANVCHDGSEEVVRAFPDQTSGGTPLSRPRDKTRHTYGAFAGQENPDGIGSTSGNAARFFYSAKADADDRLGSKHPTVKPVDLMRWLVRLITPPGGTVLDPFAGSGTTGMACLAEGIDCILIEREAEYVADIHRRISHVRGDDTPLFSIPVAAS